MVDACVNGMEIEQPAPGPTGVSTLGREDCSRVSLLLSYGSPKIWAWTFKHNPSTAQRFSWLGTLQLLNASTGLVLS